MSDCSAPRLSLVNGSHPINWRVTLAWAPSRLQRGPYTGRGAKPAGLVNGRTRLFSELFDFKIKEPARLL